MFIYVKKIEDLIGRVKVNFCQYYYHTTLIIWLIMIYLGNRISGNKIINIVGLEH